jgi:hypothetical protein
MQVKVEHAGNDKSFLKVVLREGKNREIRRVFAKLDLPVLELKRIRIGELSLHGLKAGAWRFLQANEVNDLLAVSAAGVGGGAAGAEDLADPVARSQWNSGGKRPAAKKPAPETDDDGPDLDDGDEQ